MKIGMTIPFILLANNQFQKRTIYYDRTGRFQNYFLSQEVSPLLVGVQGQDCDRSQGFNLLGQQVQSKWSTCSMVAIDGGI
jgi:hypothetical protein